MKILIIKGKDNHTRDDYYELVDFHSSRPGHDLRYSLDGEKMRSIGWELPVNFEKSLESVVHWTLNNKSWLMS